MTATQFADAGEATAYLRNHDADVKTLSRLSKPVLVQMMINRGSLNTPRELSAWTKDELMRSLLEARYPIETRHLAIHVRSHADTTVRWPDCPHCQAEALAEHTAAACETIRNASR